MDKDLPFGKRLEKNGITRRNFLKFCGLMAATLGLPESLTPRIAEALSSAVRPPIVWLEFQDCTADTESFLREPDLISLLLETISLDYHETLMVPSGDLAERSRNDIIQNYPGQYICIVEGSIPTADNGVYCTIGGRSALSIAQEVCGNALMTIAAGTCAWNGGIAAAAPNPTGATGVMGALPNLTNLINLPGCPVNAVTIAATLVYYLTNNGQWPPTDSQKRPLFAYGKEIHENCPRRQHYNAQRFVLAWGDQGHQKGWCLFKMGCKGPETKNSCYQSNWNGNTNWPVGAGHGCIGCATAGFWDNLTPFYQPLEDD